jgi:uncharacterized protein (DUF983 family)
MSRIKSLFKYKCPNCEKGNVYQEKKYLSFGKMNENCPKCKHTFEREPGFFFGAMYVSYALSIALSIGIYVTTQLFFEGLSLPFIIGLITLFYILLMPINFKMSRMVWMYLFTQKKINIDNNA